MTRIAIYTVGAVALAAGVAAAGPKFTSTWKAPDAAGVSFAGKKVAALIMTDDQGLRISGEEALVRELAGIGLTQGVASYRIVPREELRDPEKAKGWYERSGIDGVVAMRLVKADTRKTWSPSMWSSPYYNSLWGYYGYGWSSLYVYDPGETRVDQVAVVETLVFSVPLNKLLWAAVTESTNPKDANRVIKDIVTETVKQMTKQGLIRKASR
ncbi:MAG TPA: hypothetical protein VH439_07105 [Gemmatimonadales bacterium]